MPQSATIEKLTREGIISLNKIWDEEGWTIAGIVEEMKKHGEQTSESTVQKMRKKGAENNTYNYNLTIKPMLRVFARISNEPVSVSEADTPEEVQIATLNNTILMREADIAVLETKLSAAETLNGSLQLKLEENSAAEQRKISHLQQQLKDLQQLLDDRKEFMGERRDFILRLEQEKKDIRKESNMKSVLLVIVFVLMLIAFGTDAIIPLF
ncbi:MAG: hypothetical protein IJD22_02610 [Clostridia bacterium]|nr:hypothetical protein [Clostridia bacterium]